MTRPLPGMRLWLATFCAAALSLPASAGVNVLLQNPQGTTQGRSGQSQAQQIDCADTNPKHPTNSSGKKSKDCPANPSGKTANKPAPLFGGSLTIKKSSQSTDSTALGFNGVDPNGQVQDAFLSAAPSAESETETQSMASYRPTPAALTEFEKSGGLSQGPNVSRKQN